MPSRKQITLQLTPLLDLLLIVIFAQYMEVRQTAANQEQTTLDSLKVSKQELEQLREEVDRLQGESHRHKLDLTIAKNENQEVIKWVVDAIGSSEQLPKDIRDGVVQDDPKRFAKRIQEAMQNETDGDGAAIRRSIVQFIRTYAELRKRVDVHELYLAENGTCLLLGDSGEQRFELASPEELTRLLIDALKLKAGERRRILLLYSFGDVRADDRQVVSRGLDLLTTAIHDRHRDHVTFDIAEMGYQSQRPMKITP